jgi:hypothetical protein
MTRKQEFVFHILFQKYTKLNGFFKLIFKIDSYYEGTDKEKGFFFYRTIGMTQFDVYPVNISAN